MLGPILFSLAAIGTVQTPEPESTRDLAARTFAVPPAGIVSHVVRSDAALREAADVDFFTAAEPAGNGLCRRRSYYVPAGQLGRGTAPLIENTQLALARDCKSVPSSGFAWVQPPDAIGNAAMALGWLADRQRRGKGAGVTCLPSALSPDPCARGAAATFRALPLDHTYIIQRGTRPGAWNLSVMPSGPGEAFYDVRLALGPDGAGTVTIRWDVPAPF